jgi:hypothetical protein
MRFRGIGLSFISVSAEKPPIIIYEYVDLKLYALASSVITQLLYKFTLFVYESKGNTKQALYPHGSSLMLTEQSGPRSSV